MKTITTNGATQSAGELSPQEQALLQSFRRLDDRAQRQIARMSDVYAADFPRYVAPKLRVIAGGRA
jgi:hypothetical protein